MLFHSSTGRSLHLSNSIQTIGASLIRRWYQLVEYASALNLTWRKQLAGRGRFVLFRNHQKIYVLRAQESDKASRVFGKSFKKRMIEMVAGYARHDAHFRTVAENSYRRIVRVFLSQVIGDCFRPCFLSDESRKVLCLSFDLNQAGKDRNSENRLGCGVAPFEKLLRRVREHGQAEREQNQPIPRPNVGIVLRQIREDDESKVRKKEDGANQQVIELHRLGPINSVAPRAPQQPQSAKTTNEHGHIHAVGDPVRIDPESIQIEVREFGMCGQSGDHVLIVGVKRSERIAGRAPTTKQPERRAEGNN